MSTYIKKYPRAKVSRHPNLNGWVIDLIHRAGARPNRVAATYSTIAWADRAARTKLGIPPTTKIPRDPAPVPVPKVATPVAPVAPAAPKPVPAAHPAAGFGTCTPCGRPMRRAGSRAADHPGTTLRQREGLCQSCNQRLLREGSGK